MGEGKIICGKLRLAAFATQVCVLPKSEIAEYAFASRKFPRLGNTFVADALHANP